MENKNKYDLTVLSTGEDISSVKSLLSKVGADNLKVTESKNINLAYPIKKHEDAFMSVLKFDLESGAVETLNKELKLLSDDILRTLLIKETLEKESKPTTSIKRKEKEVKPEKKSKKEEDLLTNEAIEKKIEEILN